jgi:uncharacterized protein DUF4114
VRVLWIAVVGIALALFGQPASAAIVYPNIGLENPTAYDFTADSSGDLIAYFAGSSAAFDQRLGLLVNGISTGITALDNHTTVVGQSFNFGHVTRGDALSFVDTLTGGAEWFSDPALNSDRGNHVYSRSVSAGQAFAGSPAGTFVGFEDLSFPHSDFDYNDQTFVFAVAAAAPEASTWAMMMLGFMGVGFIAYRRRRLPSFRLV